MKVWESREIKLEETHKRPWAWMTTMETLVLNDVFLSPLSSLNKTKCLCLLSAKHNAFFLFPPKNVRTWKKVKPFNENQFKKLNYCATSSMSKLSPKVLFKYHFRGTEMRIFWNFWVTLCSKVRCGEQLSGKLYWIFWSSVLVLFHILSYCNR